MFAEREARSKHGNGALQGGGRDGSVVGTDPELSHDLIVGVCELTTGAEWVLSVEVLAEAFRQKMPCERCCMTQTLQCRVHEARVAEIVQAHLTPAIVFILSGPSSCSIE